MTYIPQAMPEHTKIYYEAYGYDVGDFIECEITTQRAVDICHIDARKMGGDKIGIKNRIENLMAATRNVHNRYGDKTDDMGMLYKKHQQHMDKNNVSYDHEYMASLIRKYE